MIPRRKTHGDRKHVTDSQIRAIIALRVTGLPPAKIAETLAIGLASVYQKLTLYEDARPLARAKLEAGSQALADRVVKDADVDQSIKVLEGLGVLERANSGTGNGPQVQIAVLLPGQTALPFTMPTFIETAHDRSPLS